MVNKYSFLLRTPDNIPQKCYHHNDNIVKTAMKIIKKLKTYDEIVTVAEMQSGKTEVMKRLVYIVNNFNSKLSNIKIDISIGNVYVILCTSSKNLKSQIKQKLPEITNHVYHLNDLQKFIKNRIEHDYTLANMADNSLIIFDECHSDAKSKSIIDNFRNLLKFYQKENSSKNYKVGFSATPYEQILSYFPKVIMKPGKNYYGICQMFEAMFDYTQTPVIFQAKDLSRSDQCKNLFDEVGIKNFYYIFRLPSCKKKSDKMMNNIEKQFMDKKQKFDSCIYDMYCNDTINNILVCKPKKPSIIFVKDKLRMGETLDTKYVYVVHDDPLNQYSHTTVQSLVGRCCGYNKQKNETIIYCDLDKAYQHYIWIKNNYSVENVPYDVKYVNNSTRETVSNCIYQYNE